MGRGKEEHIYYLKGPLWVPEHVMFCNSLNLWQSLVSDTLLTALALYTERTLRLKGNPMHSGLHGFPSSNVNSRGLIMASPCLSIWES